MKRPKLSEAEWQRVFEIRCKGKRGERLSQDEERLAKRAFMEDQKRYAELSPAVFEATKPAGAR